MNCNRDIHIRMYVYHYIHVCVCFRTYVCAGCVRVCAGCVRVCACICMHITTNKKTNCIKGCGEQWSYLSSAIEAPKLPYSPRV